jgi:hypothetical protein
MGRGARLGITVVLLAAAGVGVYFAVRALLYTPPTVTYSASNGQVNVTMQTVGSFGSGSHPTWVSYLTQEPSGSWVHTTIWQVPAHTKVNVTIYQFDSGSPLRNQQLGLVTGTIGDTATLNGTPFMVYDSNGANGVGHTFSIPTLGISVPLAANPGTATLCAVAPCSPTSTAYAHNVIKFSFMSPGPGSYPWQCFVPCGLAWLYGNGGPMQMVGYMGGFMKVA